MQVTGEKVDESLAKSLEGSGDLVESLHAAGTQSMDPSLQLLGEAFQVGSGLGGQLQQMFAAEGKSILNKIERELESAWIGDDKLLQKCRPDYRQQCPVDWEADRHGYCQAPP